MPETHSSDSGAANLKKYDAGLSHGILYPR